MVDSYVSYGYHLRVVGTKDGKQIAKVTTYIGVPLQECITHMTEQATTSHIDIASLEVCYKMDNVVVAIPSMMKLVPEMPEGYNGKD